MEDSVHVTCFGFGKSKSKKQKSRQKVQTKRTKIPALNISPLSSMSSDEAIKAHRLDLLQDTKSDVTAELSREIAQRQALEEQLAAALNVNAEMKVALAMNNEEGHGLLSKQLERTKAQLQKERKAKEEVEDQLAASKREAGAMRAALNAAKAQRDDLEAELMEAALDVIDGEKQRAAFENAINNEKKARRRAEDAQTDCEAMRATLKTTEASRAALEEKLQAMTREAREWEVALDSLQERLETAILNKPLESIALEVPVPSTPPQVTEQAPEKEAETTQPKLVRSQEPASPPKPEPWRQVVVRRPIAA